MTEAMSAPTARPAKPKRRFKLTDALIVLVLLAMSIFLVVTLMKQLSLKHEVNDARQTTDKLISALQKQDGTAARLLGDATFRAKNNEDQLRALFAESKPYTTGTPSVVKQTVNNGKVNKVVSIYYKFNDKKPFYVRVTALEPNKDKAWKIINFSGNQSLSALQK